MLRMARIHKLLAASQVMTPATIELLANTFVNDVETTSTLSTMWSNWTASEII